MDDQFKEREGEKRKNWKGQLQNCGHHLERVLNVLLNQLPRIGCPFNARTCPFSFISLFLSLLLSVEGRKKGFGIKRTRKATPKQPVIRSGICLAPRVCVGPREQRHPDTPQTGGTTRLRLNYSIISVEGSVGSRDPRGDATTRTPLSPWNRVPVNEKPWFPRGEKERGMKSYRKDCSVSWSSRFRGPLSSSKFEFVRSIYTVFQNPLDDS